MLQRLISVVIAILIIVWIVQSPAEAGNTVHHWGEGILTFFGHLAHG